VPKHCAKAFRHIEQTQVQIERVEQAMEKMNVRPGRKVCEAMRGWSRRPSTKSRNTTKEARFSI
jgi:ferritin-like metal-binding protein YciE